MTVVDPAEISQATMMNMKLNNLEVARQKIMVTDDPTIISNKTGGIIGTHHNGKYYICIHGGFRLEVKSLCQLLGVYPMMHYILHAEMTLPSHIKILAHVIQEAINYCSLRW